MVIEFNLDSMVDKLCDIFEEERAKSLEAAKSICSYLPEIFIRKDEEEYLNNCWSSVETNISAGLYQAAYFQFHMLFMVSIYSFLLRVKSFHKKEFDILLSGLLKGNLSEFYSENNKKDGKLFWGSLAILNESEVLCLLGIGHVELKTINEIKTCVKLRNELAHPNGAIKMHSYEDFIMACQKCCQLLKEVWLAMKEELVSDYKDTILQKNFVINKNEWADVDHRLLCRLLAEKEYSPNEINWFRKIRLNEFGNSKRHENAKKLHVAVMHYYDVITDKFDSPLNDRYVISKYHGQARSFLHQEIEFAT